MGPLRTALLGIALLTLAERGHSYRTYDLESDCTSGSASFNLSETGSESVAILKATSHTSYSMQLTCRFQVVAPPGYHVMLSVREIEFRYQLIGVCIDYIMIKGRAFCERLFREDEERHFDSTDQLPPNILKIFYRTTSGLDNVTLSGFAGFTFTITAFQKDGDHNNNSSVFKCSNDNYIWNGLTCDGHNNCGDMSDEEPYGHPNCAGSGGDSKVLIVLGLLIVFVLVVMCVATLLCTKNETVRRFSTRLRSRTISLIPSLRSRNSN